MRLALLWTIPVQVLAGQLLAGTTQDHVPDSSQVVKAVAVLESVLKTNRREDASLAQLREAADHAARKLGETHYAARMLRDSLQQATGENEDAARLLVTLRRVHESLTFRPLVEAKTPAGFPPFTPVHHIEVKNYPTYRMARVAMDAGKLGENVAFWSLFKHIKRNNIAMTAPVQINYDERNQNAVLERDVELNEAAMAFLYGERNWGTLGIDGNDANVEVLEVEPVTVVSIGVRGRMTPAKVRDATTKLTDWLGQQGSAYEATGPVRRLGYNSPFVPANRQYFEVQIPVRRKAEESLESKTSASAIKPI